MLRKTEAVSETKMLPQTMLNGPRDVCRWRKNEINRYRKLYATPSSSKTPRKCRKMRWQPCFSRCLLQDPRYKGVRRRKYFYISYSWRPETCRLVTEWSWTVASYADYSDHWTWGVGQVPSSKSMLNGTLFHVTTQCERSLTRRRRHRMQRVMQPPSARRND